MYYVFKEHENKAPSVIVEAGNKQVAHDLVQENFNVHFRTCGQCGDTVWRCWDGYYDIEGAYRVAKARTIGEPTMLKAVDRLENVDEVSLNRFRDSIMGMGYRTTLPTDEEILNLWAATLVWLESRDES